MSLVEKVQRIKSLSGNLRINMGDALTTKGVDLTDGFTPYLNELPDLMQFVPTSGNNTGTVVRLTATPSNLTTVLKYIPEDLKGSLYAVKLEPGIYTITERLTLTHNNGRVLLYSEGFNTFDNMTVVIDGSSMEYSETTWSCIKLFGSADYELQGISITDVRHVDDNKSILAVRSTGAVLVKNCRFEGYNGSATYDYWGIVRSFETDQTVVDESITTAMVIENCYFTNIWYAVGNVRSATTITFMKDISGNVSRYFTTFGEANGALIYNNITTGSLWDTQRSMSTVFDTTGVFTDLINLTNKNVVINTGTATELYKCASVDTTNGTWTGYKALYDAATRTYSFDTVVTEGLQYFDIKPSIGNIYTEDALVIIKSLWQGEPSGCIFHAPFSNDLIDTVGGVIGESWGTAPVFDEIDGRECMTVGGTGIKYTFSSTGLFENIWSPRTIMLWFRNTSGSGWRQIYSPSDNINIRVGDMTLCYGLYESENRVNISSNIWYHHAFTVSENNIKWYIDGVLKTSNTSWTPAGLLTYFTLATWSGTVGGSVGGTFYGQLADVRIYNRVLEPSEIQHIYSHI